MTKQEAINFITSLPDHTKVHVVVQETESLKASEVMALLGISRPTLCHYVKKGLITIDSNYTGKQYRYRPDYSCKVPKDHLARLLCRQTLQRFALQGRWRA